MSSGVDRVQESFDIIERGQKLCSDVSWMSRFQKTRAGKQVSSAVLDQAIREGDDTLKAITEITKVLKAIVGTSVNATPNDE